MEQLLESLGAQAYVDELVNLVRNPYSNITAALLLLAAVVIFVLLVASVVIAFVTRPARKRESAEEEELAYYLSILASGDVVDGVAMAEPPAQLTLRERVRSYPWLTWLLEAAAVVLVIGVAVGGSSASSAVCAACHEVTPHSEVVASGGSDAHSAVNCVRCHEAPGWLGRVTIEVPERMLHIMNGIRTEPRATSYGTVISPACSRCHGRVASETTEDEARGVRMSHREPLEAGAECLHCHTLETGVVSALTVGMTPCLRCHDGENQPTTCTLCHTKDVSAATRSRGNLAQMTGRVLVATPDCGGCHEEATQCDPCHGGQRMPHSELFLWWGHARAGVEDVWFNNGQTCARCHTPERRPCTKCHTFLPTAGHPASVWIPTHGASGRNASCDTCHGKLKYVNNRNICDLCHGEPLITQ
jgi:hypothetical protein